MRNFLILVCAVILISCSAKSTPQDNSQQSIDRMNSAINEMDELDSATTDTVNVPPPSQGGRALTEAEKAQRELACELNNDSEECKVLIEQIGGGVKGPEVKEKPRPTIQEGSAPVMMTKYSMKDGYPVWFHQPGYDGYLGGVGVAKKQDGGYPVQRRVAMTLAQADLARSVKVNVYNEATSERLLVDTKTQQYYKEKFSTLSRQQANEYIENPQLQDVWFNEKTGELYVWVVLPK